MDYNKFFDTEATFNTDVKNIGVIDPQSQNLTSSVESGYAEVKASLPSSLKSASLGTENNVKITELENQIGLYSNNLQKLGNRNKKMGELQLLHALNQQALKGTIEIGSGVQRELCEKYNKIAHTKDGSRNIILQNMKSADNKKQVIYALGDLILLSICWLISLFLYTRGMMTYRTYIMVFTGIMVLIILAMIYRHFFYRSIFDVRYYMDSVTNTFQKIVSYIHVELTGCHVPSCPQDCKVNHTKQEIDHSKNPKADIDDICSKYR